MYCVGLAFIAYCKYKNKDDVNTLLGAIIYTFCGFILYASIRHPYFTNACILLPLNLIGIEKLLKDNNKAYLVFIVFLTAISNYYFFYMITIINVLYFVLKYVFEYNQGIKLFFQKTLWAIGCYVAGCLMASVILLPTLYAFLNSARTEYCQKLVYCNQFYDFLFLGLICLRFKNWTVISVSAIVILMLPVLFTKMKNKENKVYATLLAITTIMLLIPCISSMMNGFSFPNNRWAFAYSFILAYIVTLCFRKDLKYSKIQIKAMTITLLVYALIGSCITKFEIMLNLDFYIAILIDILILTAIIENKRYSLVIVYCLVIVSIGVMSFALYSPNGKNYVSEFLDNNTANYRLDTLNGRINEFKKAVKFLKKSDKSFYRIITNDMKNENASLYHNYNGIQTYLSIGNGNVFELSQNLEDSQYSSVKCINGMDRRTKITTLLGAKYFICSSKDECYLPYGYELYKTIGDTEIYINKNFLSVGLVYDSYITKHEFEELTPLEKEDALITTAVLENEIFSVKKDADIKTKLDKYEYVNYKIDDENFEGNKITISENDNSIFIDIDKLKTNKEVYLNIKNLKFETDCESKAFKVTASLNGVKTTEEVRDSISSAYYMDNPDFLINLGVVRSEKKRKNKGGI